jgi:hypothetical protein
MKSHSRLTSAALLGIVAAGSLAASFATVTPAMADDHRGGYQDRGRDRAAQGHVAYDRRDDQRRYVRGYSYPAYAYQQPAYVYQAPAPVYAYPAYAYPSSSGYVHIHTPGFSLGVGF